MKYFIPDWDDLVDPHYDFTRDRHSKAHEDDPRSDKYAHELFGKAPYDGVLVSRMTLEANKNKFANVRSVGIRKYLRLPGSLQTMGDCGAWGYVKQKKPPFTTREMLDYYEKCGFDIGVSIDHLIVHPYEEEWDVRYALTRKNASEMYDLWARSEKKLRIIGVAQGWDSESYCNAVKELLEIGYDYIAIGGVAKMQSKPLIDILKAVSPIIKKKARKEVKKISLHVFGVARREMLAPFFSFGVTSFDSASFLRRAWLSSTENYHLRNENYTAIRVRASTQGEHALMHALECYGKREVGIEKLLPMLKKYELATTGNSDFLAEYVRTLRARPWEKCRCEICKNNGIQVAIFRGNNRNRRRGFHNTMVWYETFRKAVPKCAFLFSLDDEYETGDLSHVGKNNKRYMEICKRIAELPIEIGFLREGKIIIMNEGDVDPKEYSQLFIVGDGKIPSLENCGVIRIKDEEGLDDLVEKLMKNIQVA